MGSIGLDWFHSICKGLLCYQKDTYDLDCYWVGSLDFHFLENNGVFHKTPTSKTCCGGSFQQPSDSLSISPCHFQALAWRRSHEGLDVWKIASGQILSIPNSNPRDGGITTAELISLRRPLKLDGIRLSQP